MWADTRIIHYFNPYSSTHLKNQFHIHSSMILSKWSHVILLTKETMSQPGPTTKDMWISHFYFGSKLSTYTCYKTIFPTITHINGNWIKHQCKWKCRHTDSRVKSYCIERGSFWFWTFICEKLSQILDYWWTWCLEPFSRLCTPRQ